MEKKNPMTFTMSIVAIIVGAALYKQIDFKTMSVEKPALSILYAVTFLFSVAVIVRNYKKGAEK